MLHPRFLKSVGKVKMTFLASLALFALSNAAWALAADLKVPTDLAVDFRDIQFRSYLAGLTPYLIPDIHGLSIESLYHGFHLRLSHGQKNSGLDRRVDNSCLTGL